MGTVAVSTSSGHGTWAPGTATGSLLPDPDTSDDGQVQYSFINADAGVAILNLANSHADQLTVHVADVDSGASGDSNLISFSRNALVIAVPASNGYGDDVIAGRPHTLQATLLRQDPNGTSCGPLTSYDGSFNLKAWITRAANDPGGDAPAIGGTSLGNSQPSGSNLALTFSQGVSDFQLQTSDVGRFALNLRDDSSGKVLDQNGAPIPVVGTSADWVVRPFGFDLQVPGNPGAADASGGIFRKAGTSFDVTARAVQWQAADDVNDDGQPDGLGNGDPSDNASLADNDAVAHFAATGETATLASQLLAPATGQDPGVQGALTLSAFSGATATTTVTFPEVGVIDISAQGDGGFLGRAVTLRGETGAVGRFTPDHFTGEGLGAGSYKPFCTSGTPFTYIGQTFDYLTPPQWQLIPRAVAGGALHNYVGAWNKLAASDVVLSATADTAQTGIDGNPLAVTRSVGAGAASRQQQRWHADLYPRR